MIQTGNLHDDIYGLVVRKVIYLILLVLSNNTMNIDFG